MQERFNDVLASYRLGSDSADLFCAVNNLSISVERYAEYVDVEFCPGILAQFSLRYVQRTRPLLEESLVFNRLVTTVFRDPFKFFGRRDRCEYTDKNSLEVSAKILEFFSGRVNVVSPLHVVLALMAHAQFSVGEYLYAIFFATEALRSKRNPLRTFYDFRKPHQIIELDPVMEHEKAMLLAELAVCYYPRIRGSQ